MSQKNIISLVIIAVLVGVTILGVVFGASGGIKKSTQKHKFTIPR